MQNLRCGLTPTRPFGEVIHDFLIVLLRVDTIRTKYRFMIIRIDCMEAANKQAQIGAVNTVGGMVSISRMTLWTAPALIFSPCHVLTGHRRFQFDNMQ